MSNRVETAVERVLFASRWLVAPIYLGLVLCLLLLLFVVAKYVILIAGLLPAITLHQAILATVGFIDVALVANLVIIVIFSGYETFVSKMDVGEHGDRPHWMGTVDYSGLKRKLFASIVAITGIELLKAFLTLDGPEPYNPDALKWLVAIHITFLFTAVFSSFSDYLARRSTRGFADELGD